MRKCKSCGKTEWGYASLLNNEGLCWKCASEQLKLNYENYLDRITENEIKINILTHRLNELEKIIENQPLIKKYQKTLDIFLKNSQN